MSESVQHRSELGFFQTGLRMPNGLHHLIQDAAEASKRTISEEIRCRLWSSFAQDAPLLTTEQSRRTIEYRSAWVQP